MSETLKNALKWTCCCAISLKDFLAAKGIEAFESSAPCEGFFMDLYEVKVAFFSSFSFLSVSVSFSKSSLYCYVAVIKWRWRLCTSSCQDRDMKITLDFQKLLSLSLSSAQASFLFPEDNGISTCRSI